MDGVRNLIADLLEECDVQNETSDPLKQFIRNELAKNTPINRLTGEILEQCIRMLNLEKIADRLMEKVEMRVFVKPPLQESDLTESLVKQSFCKAISRYTLPSGANWSNMSLSLLFQDGPEGPILADSSLSRTMSISLEDFINRLM